MNVVEVPEDIGIKNIKNFYSELTELMKNDSEDIILDFSSVKSVDLSLIQVILTVGKKLKEKGENIILRSLSDEIRDQLKLAGIK